MIRPESRAVVIPCFNEGATIGALIAALRLQLATVIVVDDGVATGATTRAALRAIRKRSPKKLILAVPVAPTGTVAELEAEADEVVCLQSHEPFHAIGLYYEDFHQVSDKEVIDLLSKALALEEIGKNE